MLVGWYIEKLGNQKVYYDKIRWQAYTIHTR